MTGLLAGRRILVVEDEMLVLMNIELALQDLGCDDICAAGNVAEALALVDKQEFDAAMLDVNLAGEKSYPVADALTRRSIPFAFATGGADHGGRTDLDSRPVLRKPYVLAAMIAVFEQLLNDKPLRAAT